MNYRVELLLSSAAKRHYVCPLLFIKPHSCDKNSFKTRLKTVQSRQLHVYRRRVRASEKERVYLSNEFTHILALYLVVRYYFSLPHFTYSPVFFSLHFFAKQPHCLAVHWPVDDYGDTVSFNGFLLFRFWFISNGNDDGDDGDDDDNEEDKGVHPNYKFGLRLSTSFRLLIKMI